MALSAKADLDVQNRMLNESYYIAETIRYNIFDLGAQELEVIPGTGDLTVIKISHTTDYVLNGDEIDTIVNDTVFDILIINDTDTAITYDGLSVDSFSIFYNGNRINSDNINIATGSAIDILPIDPVICGYSPSDPCNEGIIKLTLTITIIMTNGSSLTPRTFVSSIIT